MLQLLRNLLCSVCHPFLPAPQSNIIRNLSSVLLNDRPKQGQGSPYEYKNRRLKVAGQPPRTQYPEHPLPQPNTTLSKKQNHLPKTQIITPATHGFIKGGVVKGLQGGTGGKESLNELGLVPQSVLLVRWEDEEMNGEWRPVGVALIPVGLGMSVHASEYALFRMSSVHWSWSEMEQARNTLHL